jgi:predicted nucleotidyltransferase
VRELPDELLREIVLRAVAVLHPLEIYLFGSHASGKTHSHSDIDLLIVVPDDAGGSIELAKRAYPALRGLFAPVELHFWTQREMCKWASVKFSLPYEATQKGRLIYAAGAGAGAAVA